MRKPKDTGMAFCESMIHYLDSLLQKRDYAGAVEYFEAHRDELAAIGGDIQASALRHLARAQASLSDYPAALKTARTAQAIAAEAGDSVLLAEIFMTTAHTLVDMGEPKEAERAYRDAESIFRRQDCPEGQVRALNHLAGLFFHQNDFHNSLAVLMDAAEIAGKLDDRKKLAYIVGNIGRIYTFIGDFAGAEKHLTMNIDLSAEMGDRLEVGRAWLSLAYVHIQSGQYAEAEKALSEAYPRILNQVGRHNEVSYLTYLGELQYRTGRLEDAKETLTQALTLAEQLSPESNAAGMARRHLAEVHFRIGNHRLAQKSAAGATVILEKSGNKIELAALLRLKAQIAASTGKNESSVKLFEQALAMFDQTGVRWEKMETFALAAASGVFPHRRCMTFLFRAEEYYSRHQMPNRLAEVTELIGRMGVDRQATPAVEEPGKETDRRAEYLTRCPEIKRFKEHLRALGRSDLPILLTGETGVGKDHLARYFHGQVCPDEPYVAVNCASVPETLLESELFGYQKGAFTGADEDKPGMFAMANGGVLYLDEIGEMPLSLQAKLLGVLERRKVMPLGGTREVELDFKLVTATNRDLEAMVEAGEFRRDLYYRISGITFKIPPLRERREDIPLLLQRFMDRSGLAEDDRPLPTELIRRFIGYDWPGNVRELENKVKRLEIMAQMTAEGDLTELALTLFGEQDMPSADDGSLFERVEHFERQLIMEAILASGGNKCEAARMLGIHEATVRVKLKRYGISYDSGLLAVQAEQVS